MMTVQLTCEECGSGVHIYPTTSAKFAKCDICTHEIKVNFSKEHELNLLKDCPCCARKDFYSQRDFNRKIGVGLFVIAAILSIWTYGMSFIVLYLFDFILFKKLSTIAVCYKCQTIFRGVANVSEIPIYDHEMNDRILYADEDFEGRPIAH